jgi:5,10-methenyltetrahydromethanopterin hydrogenase
MKIQTAKYVKCEITGEFIPESECEVVNIKIIKKKGLKFKIVSVDDVSVDEPKILKPRVTREQPDSKEVVVEDKTKLPDDIVGSVNPDAKPRAKRVPKPPAGFAGLFREPGTPGASEITRRA